LVAGSIRETLLSEEDATQTAPAPTASSACPNGTGTEATTRLPAGLMRTTWLRSTPEVATQTAPSPTATPLGPPWTGMVATTVPGGPATGAVVVGPVAGSGGPARPAATATAPATTASSRIAIATLVAR
jgi:hypothetical protein